MISSIGVLIIGILLYIIAMWFVVQSLDKSSLTFIFLVWSALSIIGILVYAKVYGGRTINPSVVVSTILILIAVIVLCYDQWRKNNYLQR